VEEISQKRTEENIVRNREEGRKGNMVIGQEKGKECIPKRGDEMRMEEEGTWSEWRGEGIPNQMRMEEEGTWSEWRGEGIPCQRRMEEKLGRMR
jgi:hypothetical protein